MTPLDAIIIAIVEGITEFLPISSTGHMIIASAALGLPSTDFTKAFIVNIQFGAILSVLVIYWRKFLQSLDFYVKLAIAFLPAAVFGLLFHSAIDRFLENITVVAVTMVAGGVVLLFVDGWLAGHAQDQAITARRALIIGFFQCIAMIPGVSRSAATIIGGMSQKLTRRAAAEFSFFLAVPTMFAAASFKVYKMRQVLTADMAGIMLLGNAVAFVVAFFAIKGFIAYLTKHGFKIFGWYRIIVGVIILAMSALGWKL